MNLLIFLFRKLYFLLIYFSIVIGQPENYSTGLNNSGFKNSNAISFSDTNKFDLVKEGFLVSAGCGEYGANQYRPFLTMEACFCAYWQQ